MLSLRPYAVVTVYRRDHQSIIIRGGLLYHMYTSCTRAVPEFWSLKLTPARCNHAVGLTMLMFVSAGRRH